jgi:hypothetical protein
MSCFPILNPLRLIEVWEARSRTRLTPIVWLSFPVPGLTLTHPPGCILGLLLCPYRMRILLGEDDLALFSNYTWVNTTSCCPLMHDTFEVKMKKKTTLCSTIATTTHNIVFLLHWFLVQPDNLKETSLIIEQNVTQKWNTVSNKPSFLEDGRFKQSFLHKMSYLVLNSSSFVSSR